MYPKSGERRVRGKAGGAGSAWPDPEDHHPLEAERVGGIHAVEILHPRESRKCSRDTYPESYITKYTSIRRLNPKPLQVRDRAGGAGGCGDRGARQPTGPNSLYHRGDQVDRPLAMED